MAMSKVNAETLRKARKAGFRRKAPKKPSRSASASVLTRYIDRHNDYAKEAAKYAKQYDEAERLKKRVFGA